MVTGGSSSSKGSTAPWAEQAGYLKDIYEQAQGLFSGGPYEYGPSRVSGFDPSSERAFGMIEGGGLGAGAQELRGDARAEIERTLGGEYMSPGSNPYLQGTYDDAAEGMRRNYYGAINDLGSSMAASGRAGGSSHAAGRNVTDENFSRGLGSLGNQIFGGAYERERDRMGSAVGQAGQLASGMSDENYRRANALRQVGSEREMMSQRFRDELVDRFNYSDRGGELEERLARYSGFIGQPVMTSRQRSKSMNFGVGGGGCWVAAEFFGWFTPKWFAARKWIMEDWQGEMADGFRSFYLEHGPALAETVRNDADAREEWRPFFEMAAELGA